MSQRGKANSPPTGYFFERQLKPEPPVALDTASRLCSAARHLFSKQPWQLLQESDLVFVDGGPGAPLLVCSVMGQMGQVYSLVAYMGMEGYHFFRKLQTAESMTAGEFLSEQNTISAEYVRRRELTKPDRELLQAVGPEWVKSPVVPMFRTARPGYHPWYPNENEARMLIGCLEAMNWFLEHLPDDPVAEYWQDDNTFPKLSRPGDSGFRIEMTDAPRAPIAMPRIPPMDTARVQHILAAGGKPNGTLEVDEFLCAAMVGEAHQRKSCVRIGLAIDALTGFAFPPEVAGADAAPGELLCAVVMKALETGAPIPARIHVRKPEPKLFLDHLAEALGAKIVVKKALPALDSAKRSLMQLMGESEAR